MALLGNKPKIYEESSMGMGISLFGNWINGVGGDQQGGIGAMGGGGVGGLGSAGPRLDLTSAMLSNTNYASSNMNSMPVAESSMQLPRPCKFTSFRFIFVYICICMYLCIFSTAFHGFLFILPQCRNITIKIPYTFSHYEKSLGQKLRI